MKYVQEKTAAKHLIVWMTTKIYWQQYLFWKIFLLCIIFKWLMLALRTRI